MDITLNVTVSINNLIDAFVDNVPDDEAASILMMIDAKYENWDVSEALFKALALSLYADMSIFAEVFPDGVDAWLKNEER